MKPLYITFSNGAQPYQNMAEEFCHRVNKLDAGDCIHLCQPKPEDEKIFEIAIFSKIFVEVGKNIEKHPVIALDSDCILRKPTIELFDSDWDIAAVYRNRIQIEYGRQDYCSAIVMFNNKRPDAIKCFCSKWLEKMRTCPIVPGYCPIGLKNTGWTDTWWADQSAFNEIIAPVEGEAIHGEIYIVNDYRILPLKDEEYGKRGIFIKHLKGKRRWKDKCRT